MFEVSIMRCGRISGSTMEFTNNFAEAVRAFDKCKSKGKVILKLKGGRKRIIKS